LKTYIGLFGVRGRTVFTLHLEMNI